MPPSENRRSAAGPAGGDVVRVRQEGDVAFVLIDNPPVNALSRELRQAMIEALARLSADAATQAIVIMGAGNTFIAGADLREFGQPLTEPTLPDVLSAIEACPKPVVAAIRGAALGGGYEVALACDGRVAAPDAAVGLPEGTFGIIPGAGGTARIARLTDAATALEIVSSCRLVKAQEALSLGLIDAIVGNAGAEDAGAAAADFARGLRGTKRRLRDLPPRPVDAEAFSLAEKAALRRGRGRPYAREQVAALRRAAEQPFDQALAQDRAVFQHLRDTEESAALRHIFFAEREAQRVEGLAGTTAHPVTSVGIVGAGTMGSGIAAAFLAAGIPVTLVDSKPQVLEAAKERVAGFLSRAARPAALTTSAELADLGSCGLVLEAVFEDMTVKQAVMRQLDAIARHDAILASNTSYLDLDAIAAATSRPERVVGLHFFAPAHVMRLLEIVRGEKTAPDVLATALMLAKRLRKVAVVSRVAEGFIGNRIYNAYRAQCEAMLMTGALPHEIDEAIEAFGFAMGPFAVSDLSGLDIAWANRKRKQEMSGDHGDVPVLEWLVAGGRLGRKTGAGWYRYEDGVKQADPAVTELIRKARAERGIVARPMEREEIQGLAMAAIVNEALLVLAEGVATRASDIDLVLIHGYGFPRHLGGPLHWAVAQDRAVLEDRLAAVARDGRRGDSSLLHLGAA